MSRQMQKAAIEKTALAHKKRLLIVDNKSAHLEALQEIIREKISDVEYRLQATREVTDESVLWADLIVLSGGTGLSIEKNPKTFQRLIEKILAASKPVIGICLGAQAIGVHFGAVLIDIGVRRVGNIAIYFRTDAAQELRVKERMIVYEFHRWKIDTVPDPLVEVARSKDGVEVMRHASLPVWGLQFHPEVRRRGNGGHAIFESIVQAILS